MPGHRRDRRGQQPRCDPPCAVQDDLGTDQQADAQLDEAHIAHLAIDFDPDALPAGQFVYPWQVWEDHRGRLNEFGHGDATGLWFLRVNLARDLLALTGNEVSDWDSWRGQTATDKLDTPDARAHCAELARAARKLSQMAQVDAGRYAACVAKLTTPHWGA